MTAVRDTLASIENVTGTSNSDDIRGTDEDNEIDGNTGDDVPNGRDGNDTLTGGAGADVFEFVNSRFDDDNDIVTDFEVGVDKIDFSNNANAIDDFAEFLEKSEQSVEDVVVDTGDGTITLENVQLDDLTANDFYF